MELETQTNKRLDRWMQACSVLIVFAYAWIAAFSLEPKFPEPAKLVSTIDWKFGDEVVGSRAARNRVFVESSQIAGAMLRAQSTLRTIGGLRKPIVMTIDTNLPERYSVTHEKIEIGLSIATKPGEIERAFVKTWLYQHGDPAIVASLFRMNVAADTLAMVAVGMAPESARSWIEAAAPFDGSCKKPWRAMELQTTCAGSEQTSPFSFRPFVAGVIVRAQARLPISERVRFLSRWAASLSSDEPSDREIADPRLPEGLEAWRDWLRAEIATLVPQEDFSDFSEMQNALDKEMSSAQLEKSSRLTVDAVFHREKREEIHIKRRTNDRRTYVVLSDEGEGYLFPGRVAISADDVKKVSARALVWESCKPPRLGELLKVPVSSEHLVYLQSCETSGQGWASYLRGGITQLAKDEPSLPFLQLRRDQVAFAIERGEMNPKATIDRYMEREPKLHSLLGLESAVWKKEYQAYRALGAIEAVEWFRTSLAPDGI